MRTGHAASVSHAPAWVVIAAGVAAALHVGKLSPALPVLSEALGVTLVQAGFLLSLVQLAGMTLGLAVGLTADSLGLRRSMISGLLLLTVASLLGGWATNAETLLALRAVEGLGFLLVSMPAPSLIRQLVAPERMSATLGLWGAYMPLGTASALLCGPLVIAWTGWASWWWLLALLTLVMAWVVWLRVPPDHLRGRSGAHGGLHGRQGWSHRLRQTLSAPGPWLVALSFAMYSGQWLAVIGFLPTIYAQGGMASGTSALLTAMVAAVNMGGNIVSGRLLSRGVPPQRLLYTGFTVMGLGTLLTFAAFPAAAYEGLPMPLRFVAVLLFSMVGGMIPGTLFSLAVRLAPGDGTVSTTVGWMQQWASLGQFAGPPLVAWLASRAGGWHWTWVITGVCSLVGIILAVYIRGQLRHR